MIGQFYRTSYMKQKKRRHNQNELSVIGKAAAESCYCFFLPLLP